MSVYDIIAFVIFLTLRRSMVISKTFDDSNPAITYLPLPSAWQITTDPTLFNGTSQ